VKNDDSVVSGQPKIAFYSGTQVDRRIKRGEAVFRNGKAGVQAPVSKTRRARIERIRP
jgi:hypothetical protein